MSNVSIVCTNAITIGKETGFGAGCFIMDSIFHSLNYRLRRAPSPKNELNTTSKPIVIEDNVFVEHKALFAKVYNWSEICYFGRLGCSKIDTIGKYC